ncbi:MAG: sugar phosphate nucleotidyltransferase [Chitinophagales bacterium]
MNIIIPMAGWGSRLRPHTLTIPKPMLPVAGKPIVHRLVEDLMRCTSEKVENMVFIIRADFGKAIEAQLLEVARQLGVPGHIRYQDSPEGTAHAILCAGDFLNNRIIVAFADTLFRMEGTIDTNKEGVIFVQRVADPSAYGVVKLDASGVITDFIEKPKEFVSDLAIIGIYYFREGAQLRAEMQYLIDHDLREKGEYQLTNAMETLKQKGARFEQGTVQDWLDCGNKNATVDTNAVYLGYLKGQPLVHPSVQCEQSVIIEPCFIAEGVKLINSVVGPHVSIGKNSVLENTIVRKSIIQEQTSIKNKLIDNSMVGNNVKLVGKFEDLSVGDYTSAS